MGLNARSVSEVVQKGFRGCAVQWFPNLAARCSYLGKTLDILIVFTDKDTVCQM